MPPYTNLTGIVLGYRFSVERGPDLFRCGHGQYLPYQGLPVKTQPVQYSLALDVFRQRFKIFGLAAALAPADGITFFDKVGRDIGLASVQHDVTVPHDLAGLLARIGEPQPVGR